MSADLAVIVNDPGAVERAADPAEFVIQACERAKAWLRTVLDHGDIGQIAEIKSQAEAIRVYTMQKQLGKDAQLSAAEIVRRAERGLGVAIRRGQAEGTIRRQGQGRGYTQQLPRPTDFASHDELMGNRGGIYDLADGVPDEIFEDALSDACAEENVSRANLVRKIRERKAGRVPGTARRSPAAAARRRELIRELAGQGYSSRQIGERIGTLPESVRAIARDIGVEISADEFIGRTRRHDSNRIVRETASALEGLAMGIGLIDPGDLDQAEIANWAASLTDSLRVLNRLARQLREMAQ